MEQTKGKKCIFVYSCFVFCGCVSPSTIPLPACVVQTVLYCHINIVYCVGGGAALGTRSLYKPSYRLAKVGSKLAKVVHIKLHYFCII